MEFDYLHFILFTALVATLLHHLFTQHGPTSHQTNQKQQEPQIPPVSPPKFIDFLLTVGKLKQEKRTGWVNNDIPIPESIADHMYRMAVMGLFIRDPSRQSQQTSCVALVHDIAEALVGDITPQDTSGITPEAKHKMEDEAINTIASSLVSSNGNTTLSDELHDLYAQYNSQTTPEGRFCKQLDKLEMLIQAYEYETLHPEKNLEAFYRSANKGIHDPYLKELQNEILKRREIVLKKGKIVY